MHNLLLMGSSIENIELVKKAKNKGYYTIVCDGYEKGPAKKYADKSYTIDIADTETIAAMCRREKIDGIIGSFSDYLFECTTNIAAETGLKWYIRPDNLKYYRDKHCAKELMKNLGIKAPAHLLTEGRGAEDIASQLRFPMVLKNVSGWGSRGTRIAKNIETLDGLLQWINETGFIYEAEEYCDGPEFNIQAWVKDDKVIILGIADREKYPPERNNVPFLKRIIYPSSRMDILPKVRGILQKYVRGTGQQSGPVCMQCFLKNEDIVVCEIAGRLLGWEHEMLYFSSRVDVEEMLLDLVYDEEALNKKLGAVDLRDPDICAVLHMMVKEGEKVFRQPSTEHILQDKNCIMCRNYFNIGDTVEYANQISYFSQIFVHGKTRGEVDSSSKKIFRDYRVYNEKNEEIQINNG